MHASWSVAVCDFVLGYRAETDREIPALNAAGLGFTLLGLHRTADLRKDVVGVAADQFDRTDHDDQNYCEHDGIFSNVLTAFLSPKLTDFLDHLPAPNQRLPLATYTLGTLMHRRVIHKIS